MSKASGKGVDRLAELLRGVPPKRLDTFLAKRASLSMRLSETDLAGMKKMAKGCGLTVTEYLTRLHYFAEAKRGSLKGQQHSEPP